MQSSDFNLDVTAVNTDNSPVLFEKRTVIELTDGDLMDVQGGTSPAYAASAGLVWVSIQIGKAGYEVGQWLQ